MYPTHEQNQAAMEGNDANSLREMGEQEAGFGTTWYFIPLGPSSCVPSIVVVWLFSLLLALES